MPTTNYIDFTVPDCFAYEQMNMNSVWTSIHGNRTYAEHSVPDKPKFPYGVIRVVWRKPLLFTGQRYEYISKSIARVEIISVRLYEDGKGAWTDFRSSWNEIRQQCTGAQGNDGIAVHDATGAAIGTVWQSRYLDTIAYVAEDGQRKVYHGGIALHVTYL